MKRPFFPCLIFVAVAAQILWLSFNYYARTEEIRTGPHLFIKSAPYDPRDLARGYYHSLSSDQRHSLDRPLLGTSLYWGKPLLINIYGKGLVDEITELPSCPAQREGAIEIVHDLSYSSKRNKEKKLPLAAFWKQGADHLHHPVRIEAVGSPEDKARPGELRTPIRYYHISGNYDVRNTKQLSPADLTLIWNPDFMSDRASLRYFIPEDKRDFMSILRENYTQQEIEQSSIVLVIEQVLREGKSAIPHQLYLNGIPYIEAVELMKQRKFPLQAPTVYSFPVQE